MVVGLSHLRFKCGLIAQLAQKRFSIKPMKTND